MKRIITIVFLIALSATVFAQSTVDPLYFKHYTVADGLSQNTVNCILKVPDGSLWIGTDDGLNHFNGHEFVIYRNKVSDPRSLSHNNVLSLVRDSLNRLWIGTARGLNLYDPESDNFVVFKDNSNSIYCLAMLMDQKRKRIWLASEENGLKYLDLTTETIKEFVHPALATAAPTTFAFDDKGRLLVGTSKSGVFRLNPETSEIAFFNTNHSDTLPSISNNTVHALLAKDETLWIATEGGLNKLDFKTNKVEVYSTLNHALQSDLVWSLAMDQNDDLWIGTDGGGLTTLEKTTSAFKTYRYSGNNLQGLSGNTLRTIYVDNEGNTWIGTYNNGVNYFNQASKNFHHYAKFLPCSSLEEIPDGMMLIGTDGEGLLEFNFSTKSLTSVEGIKCKKILAIHRDRDGGIWMGTFQEGLHYKKNNIYHIYMHDATDSTSLRDNTIWAIEEDAMGNIWIATENGLCRFNKETGKFEDFLKLHKYKFTFYSALVYSLLIDSKGRIWMGGSSYIGYFNPKDHSHRQYTYQAGVPNSVSNSITVSMIEKDGYIWAGTFGGGLNRLNPETNEVIIIDEEKGLPNNTVFSLEKDDKGNLWMSTNKGIIKFNESKNEFSVYGSEVGVLNKTFYVGASHRNFKGEMIFGGNNGFSVFKPDNVIDNNQNITASITGILDNNNLHKPRPLILNKDSAFTIDYNDSRFLGFILSAFHYLAPEDENYSYRLPQVENVWRNIDKQRDLIFNNLDPGSYTLEVKAGVNNLWSTKITKIYFTILTPWWMSIYFKVGLIMILILVVMTYNRVRVKRFQKRQNELERLVFEKTKEIQNQADELVLQNHELSTQNEQIVLQASVIEVAQGKLSEVNNHLEETVEKRTSELKEAYKELDIFFYRASHDFRRPLTTFMGLAEVAKLTVKDANSLELFTKVNETAQNLEKMVNKLQSMSEIGASETIYQTVFLENELVRVHDHFKDELKTIGIDFKTEIIGKSSVNSYPDIIRLIIVNLVENAIQFCTPLDPFIHIKVFEENGNLNIQIKDNGEGILPEYQTKIFDMYFKASERSTGNGLGLYIVKKSIEKINGSIHVTSTRGQGTNIIIQIPLL